MVVIGVTGGFGTGKSTVARMFKELGAVVLDADALSREATEPKRLAWRRIVKLYGPRVLNEDQTIDRRALAELVFSDEPARRRLEAMIHPQVIRRIKQQLHQLRRQRSVRAVVLDVPLLFEVGAEGLADAVVVVTAQAEVRARRLRKQAGWTQEAITRRDGAQWELSAKVALADYVVDNANGLEQTRTQVRRIWSQLVATNR